MKSKEITLSKGLILNTPTPSNKKTKPFILNKIYINSELSPTNKNSVLSKKLLSPQSKFSRTNNSFSKRGGIIKYSSLSNEKSNYNKTVLSVIYDDIEKTKQIIDNELKTLPSRNKKINRNGRCYYKNSSVFNNNNNNNILLTTTSLFTTSSGNNNISNNNKANTTQSSFNKTIHTSKHKRLLSISIHRKKTFVIAYIPNWHEKNQIPHMKFTKDSLSSKTFQSKTIHDEHLIIQDSIQIFRQKHLSKQWLFSVFLTLNPNTKTKINKILEELIGLMITLSYLLLRELGDSVDQFILNPQWRVSHAEDKIVHNEDEEFRINSRTFNNSANFLKSCEEVYEIVLNKEIDFRFKGDYFVKILQFLQRIRLNIGELIFTFDNVLNDYFTDEQMVKEYIKQKRNIDNNEKGVKFFYYGKHKKHFSDVNEFHPGKNSVIDSSQIKFNANSIMRSREIEKKRRMCRLLDENKLNIQQFNDYNRKIGIKKFDINSKMIDKLIEYGTEEFKGRILSERIMRRFYEMRKREQEENNNFI